MTHALPWIDVVGFWLEIFLTFCILSYLYKDNPFYKLSEHLFVGVSIGYIVTQQYYNTIKPNLIARLGDGSWAHLLPLALVLMLFLKAASRKLSWVGRYPLAFVVALYAGIQVNAVAQSDLAEQIKASVQPVSVEKVDVSKADATALAKLPGFSPPLAEAVVEARGRGEVKSLDDLAKIPGLSDMQRADLAEARGHVRGLDAQATVGSGGGRFWFGMFSNLLLLAGLLCSLVYFYFSVEQKGAIGKISRFGIWILMIGFGASFGYTVQGRLSLAVGRALSVLGEDKAPVHRAQIDGPWVALGSIIVIILGLVIWERRQRNAPPPPTSGAPPPASGAATGGDEDLPAY
jgi:hypothetical protein